MNKIFMDSNNLWKLQSFSQAGTVTKLESKKVKTSKARGPQNL